MYNFKVNKNFLKDRLEEIPPYTSFKEKEGLLQDDITLTEMFDILCPDSKVKPLNEIEAGAFLLKSREISISDTIEGLIECSCGAINNFSIEIKSLFDFNINSNINEIPVGLFETVEEVINNSDELSLKDYNNFQDKIHENNKKILKVEVKNICRVCKKDITSVINPIDYISKTSVAGIYDEYFSLTFYTNMTKQDIDNMYPFERGLFLGLLKKKLESQPTI